MSGLYYLIDKDDQLLVYIQPPQDKILKGFSGKRKERNNANSKI
ncbi:hypothetical protein [Anaerocolumna aminovalerica]|nr:hypothetical protein [Anaerocolumna aminovalerica]